MREASKTRRLRGPDFYQRYLQGRIIDIGCGDDLVVPTAEPFDVVHGDAERISAYRPRAAYDGVHSSHCLEHMSDVPTALADWWSLVRPGGHLIVVVPDEDRYEQGIWPSLFNDDHKATFRYGKESTWSPRSFDLERLLRSLPEVDTVEIEVQAAGYDPRLQHRGITRFGRIAFRVKERLRRFTREHGLQSPLTDRLLDRLLHRFGAPIDQTRYEVLAQFQAIVRKRAPSTSAEGC